MINYIEHHIVDHCNLKCAGCSHFSPIAEPWFEDIEDFKADFMALARLTDVRTIRIMGGEPLLHPQVLDFLRLTREIFPYAQIQVVTNGILIPKKKDELLEVCNSNNILVCVSNYHLNFNVHEVLKGFRWTRVDEKGQFYNISLDMNGAQDPIQAFNRCDLHVNHWYYFQNGRLYPCCIGANLQQFIRHFELDWEYNIEDISISIHDHTLKEILSFLDTPRPLCKYCNTERRLHTYSPFHVSKGDISEWTYQ